jgi:endonuclease YncB( thermonuclease family)
MAVRILLASLLAAAALAAAAAVPAQARRGPCVEDGSGPRCTFWDAKVAVVYDGDTVAADVMGDGTRAPRRVRFTGINTMELGHHLGRRPACHALAAKALVKRYVRASHARIRVAAQRASSRSGVRLRRAVWVKVGGRWRDLSRILVERGLALWLPNDTEYAHNGEYAALAELAAAARRGLYDPAACGLGPDQDLPVSVDVNWDALGEDGANLAGEWVAIHNGGARPLRLDGWWLRDGGPWRGLGGVPGYGFPPGTVVPAGGSLRLRAGCGLDTATDLHWCLHQSLFGNVTGAPVHRGDGAYLFDPDGDVRASMIYPCLAACADPLGGVVRLGVHASRPESITVVNTGAQPVDLGGHILKQTMSNAVHAFSLAEPFERGTVLAPGQALRILPQGSPSNDTPLVRHLAIDGYALPDDGAAISLRTLDDLVTTCTAWGRGRC